MIVLLEYFFSKYFHFYLGSFFLVLLLLSAFYSTADEDVKTSLVAVVLGPSTKGCNAISNQFNSNLAAREPDSK